MNKYIATVIINNNIEYKYSYGEWAKCIDGEQVSSGKGFSYEDFIQMILRQYPLNTVDQFYLVS